MRFVSDTTRIRQAAIALGKARKAGQKQLYDRQRIKELLLAGWTFHQIAREMGCSTYPVQVVKAELRELGFSFKDQHSRGGRPYGRKVSKDRKRYCQARRQKITGKNR